MNFLIDIDFRFFRIVSRFYFGVKMSIDRIYFYLYGQVKKEKEDIWFYFYFKGGIIMQNKYVVLRWEGQSDGVVGVLWREVEFQMRWQ